jgi:hypothetical protein
MHAHCKKKPLSRHAETGPVSALPKTGLPRVQRRRRGYALLLVMIFVALFAAVLGVAWRRTASALRIERASELRKRCDQGSLTVLAQAMTVLESRIRANPGGVTLDGATSSEVEFKKEYPSGSGQWYKISFSRSSTSGTNPSEWTVAVSAISADDAMSIAESLPNDPPS